MEQTRKAVERVTGIREHAILYALICRKLITRYGREKGEELIERMTVAYGRKRGARMRANSEKGDLSDYFISGEWKGRPGENLSRMIFEEDRTLSEVSRCAWYEAWRENDLLEYGTYYCRYIDKAICEGYDPKLKLEVREALGYGDGRCLFIWNSKADEELVTQSERRHILDFDHHCAELFSCMREQLPEEDRGEIAESVAAQFAGYGGEIKEMEKETDA